MALSEAEYRALLARRGQTPASPRAPKRSLPAVERQYPEAAFYQALQAVGEAHGWLCECSWMPHGEDQGLCCWLVRPPELVYALIRVAERPLTSMQAQWLTALRKTRVEVVEWRSDEVKVMQERLGRARVQAGTLASTTSPDYPSCERSNDERAEQ